MGDQRNFCTFYDAVKFTIIGMLYGALLVFILLTVLGVFDSTEKLTIQTGKKQPVPVVGVVPIRADGSAAWTHVCCDCALTHEVVDRVIKVEQEDGTVQYFLETTWTTNVKTTEKNRREKWGPFWQRGSQGDQLPWSAEFPGEPF